MIIKGLQTRISCYGMLLELFFKWIKQHLRIKRFFGTSPNAVKTQVWIAICVYVIIAILKKQFHLQLSLHRISQILSISAFETVPLYELLTDFDQAPRRFQWYLRGMI